MTKPLVKSVVHGAKTIGKRAIKSASIHGLKKIAKKVAKEGASEIARAGTEKLLEQLDLFRTKLNRKERLRKRSIQHQPPLRKV